MHRGLSSPANTAARVPDGRTTTLLGSRSGHRHRPPPTPRTSPRRRARRRRTRQGRRPGTRRRRQRGARHGPTKTARAAGPRPRPPWRQVAVKRDPPAPPRRPIRRRPYSAFPWSNPRCAGPQIQTGDVSDKSGPSASCPVPEPPVAACFAFRLRAAQSPGPGRVPPDQKDRPKDEVEQEHGSHPPPRGDVIVQS